MKRILKAIFPTLDYLLVFVAAIIATAMGSVFWTSFHPLIGLLVGTSFFLFVTKPCLTYILYKPEEATQWGDLDSDDDC
jgi:hypothetical protein